jgi:hypothetical protein
MEKGKPSGDGMLEWLALGQRLKAASPARYRAVLEQIEEIVGGQEAIAEHDDQLILRARRPTKRYAS